MQLLEKIKTYHSLFGPSGVILAAKARFLGQEPEKVIKLPSVAHPVHLRLGTTDLFVCRSVLVEGEYQLELPKPPKAIVDAGANIGLTSVFYANRYPQAKIIAIEPEKTNFEMLKKNTSGYPNVIPVRAALWKEDKEIHLDDPGLGYDEFRTSDGECAGAKGGSVPGMTVEKVMSDFCLNYIDVLKIDIEGSEKEVFEKPFPWIDKVGVIAIELHDRIRPGCSRSFYSATKDFAHEVRKGETVFLMRDA
jgi:FkbM family methyltransferase